MIVTCTVDRRGCVSADNWNYLTLITLKSRLSIHSDTYPREPVVIFKVIFILPLWWQIFSSFSPYQGFPGPKYRHIADTNPQGHSVSVVNSLHFFSSIILYKNKLIKNFFLSFMQSNFLHLWAFLLADLNNIRLYHFYSKHFQRHFVFMQSSFPRRIHYTFFLCLLLSSFVCSSFCYLD